MAPLVIYLVRVKRLIDDHLREYEPLWQKGVLVGEIDGQHGPSFGVGMSPTVYSSFVAAERAIDKRDRAFTGVDFEVVRFDEKVT